MRLYEEIFKNPEGMALSRFTVAVGGGGYFEGVKAVGDFSPQKIVLYFPRGSVDIEGADLFIRKYCDGDLELAGRICSVKIGQETPQKGA
ncbi:MAG: YabP/YqfC family sporulation protein [Clostridia bacterium]|nr:YabP/YqfC family sporulation protein [Clostridia bacterium]